MKTVKLLTLIFWGTLLLNSCEKDGERIQVNGLESSELQASESNVVLSTENANTSVLALTWTESTLSSSNNSVSLPSSLPITIIEVSSTNTFDSYVEIAPITNIYAFKGAALNTLAKDLGFKHGVSTPMYFRMNVAYGKNTNTHYSSVITVNVNCYSMDMSVGLILNADKEDTGFTLYSPNGDGEYYGFTGVDSWGNWYMQEGDGTMWGNLGEDNSEFKLSNDQSSFWNFWYPGQSDCYYTTLSVNNKEWTATLIPALTVSGDLAAEMMFDKARVKWFVSLTASTANTKLKVSCANASLFNISTGTDDASAIAKSLGFIANNDSTLSLDWNSESATEINIPAAGDFTLTFYLADPTKWTYEISSGAIEVPDTLSKYLYLPGIDDGTSGAWTFDNYLHVLNKDDSTFAGAVAVNSLWGYQMSLELDNWTDVYQMGATEGSLAFKGGTNITAPDSGLYLLQADLKNLTYSHTPIGNKIYLGGLNGDVWDFNIALTKTSRGVFTGTVDYTTASTWGFKIYIAEDDWDHFFGGSFSTLEYSGNAVTDVQNLALGTYKISVDLINRTCSFVAQ